MRILVFVTPVVAGWLAVWALSPSFVRPAGWFGIGLWVVQAFLASLGVATLVDRLARQLSPLATLLGMSLTFPDKAPSRFGVALRSGTLSKLQSRLDDLDRNGAGSDAQEAAVKAIELVTLLGHHDRLTRGHTDRVRAYADMIAVELGHSDEDRQMLAWGVALHDIGKLKVPAEILNKRGRPDEREWAILASHPSEGARIVAPLSTWLGQWGTAAGQHHERWDGKGYPNQLRGREISLAGRIAAVADAYDVITSRRSYKAPLSTEAARKELVDCAGAQFDPAIVRALLQASISPRRRIAGMWSWLLEVPGLASVTHAVAAAPAALATVAVVASAPLLGLNLPPSEPIPEFAATTSPGETPASTTEGTSPVNPEPSPDTNDDKPGGATTAISGPDTTRVAEPVTSEVVPPTASGASTTPVVPETPTSSTTLTTNPVTTRSTVIAAPTSSSTTPISPTTSPALSTTTTTTTTVAGRAGGPVARDDAGTQRQSQRRQHPVLDNDFAGAAALDPASLTIIAGPTHGTAEVWNNNKIRYQARTAHTGSDTVAYRICDLNGQCAQATLTIELTS